MASIYSEEWNATCGQRLATIRVDANVGAPYLGFSWFLIVLTLVVVPVSLIIFFIARTKWAYIRKRNAASSLFAGLGNILQCLIGPGRDVIGREIFLCDLTLWGRIFAFVSLCIPMVYMLNFFRDQWLWSKAISAVSFQKLQEIIGDGEIDAGARRKSVFLRKSVFSTTNNARITDARPSGSPDEETASEKGSVKSGTRIGSGNASGFDEAAFHDAMYKQEYKYKAFVMLMPLVPPIILGLGFQFGLPYYGHGCVGCVEEPYFLAVIAGTVSVFVVNIAWTSYALREAPDPLGILSDLKKMVVGGGIIGMPGILGVLVDTIGDRPYDRAIFSFDWLVCLSSLWFFFFLCPAPVLTAYWSSRKVGTDGKLSLKPLLSNLQFQKIFTEHLVGEWSIENLKFYNQVNSFRDHYAGFKSSKEANVVAFQTFETFVKPGAVMEVNISADQRQKLEEEFGKLAQNFNTIQIEKTIFDEAQTEILLLMEKDSFSRFQLSKTFKNFASANLVVSAAGTTIVAAAN